MAWFGSIFSKVDRIVRDEYPFIVTSTRFQETWDEKQNQSVSFLPLQTRDQAALTRNLVSVTRDWHTTILKFLIAFDSDIRTRIWMLMTLHLVADASDGDTPELHPL